jgi:hypothetical protein
MAGNQGVIPFGAFLSKARGAVVGRSNNQGQPYIATRPGNTWFVDETNGSDTQPNAGFANTPFATLAAALAVLQAGDTIYIIGTVHVTATVVFNKDNVRVIGLNGPSANNRARISQSGSTVFTPLVSVTAQGCYFENLATFHGFASATTQICWTDSGGRNGYKNVQFLGGGNATAAAQAGMRSLLITGGNGECLFEGCRIGLDTVIRATNANASLEMAAGSPRNVFNNCTFSANCSAAGDVHVLVGSGGIDRYAEFNNCTFSNFAGGGGTTLTAAFSVHASAGGNVLVNGGISVGAGKISAAGPVYVNGAVPTAGTSSLGVQAS